MPTSSSKQYTLYQALVQNVLLFGLQLTTEQYY